MVNKINLYRLIACVVTALFYMSSYAQGFNAEKKELSDFLTRMYKSEPFEGVRVVTDYDHTYLLSVLTLDKSKYPSPSALNRVASVKAMSEAGRYFNGSSISSDLIIHMTEEADGTSDSRIIEHIHERSAGYIKQLEQLTNFTGNDGRQVFIYYKQLDE